MRFVRLVLTCLHATDRSHGAMLGRLARDNSVIKAHLRESEAARERSEKVQEIEYVKHCVVKYLETSDDEMLSLLCKALHLREEETARFQRSQLKAKPGFFGWLARHEPGGE